MVTQARRRGRISAQDLYRIQNISDPTISPDGRHVAFSVQRVDRESERKFSNLWVVPTGGGAARQFTYGDQQDTRPRWSPDGSQIAFLSNRSDGSQSQIHVIPFGGGEARPLTDLKGKFGSFEWSPDGSRLAFEFQKRDQEDLEREADERKRRLGIVSRHYTRVHYKWDGIGFLAREQWHIWTVNARTGRASQLTDGPVHAEREPCWTPDGSHVAYTSNVADDPDFAPDSVDIFVMPAEGGEARKIETHVGRKGLPSVSPDGRWIAFTGRSRRSDWWQHDNLWVVPFDGSAPPRDLTGRFDVSVSNSTMNDLGGADMTPPTWSPDSKSIYFQVSEHGNTTLRNIPVEGGDMLPVIDDEGVVGAYSFDDSGTRIAYFHASTYEIGQVWTRRLDNGRKRRLTRFNDNILRRVELGEVKSVWFEGAAGNDLQGWVLTPPDFDPSEKYPTLVEIHGGPQGQYGNFFMFEFFYLAAQGYVVTYSNPRGGTGYGEAHGASIWNAAGTADYDDVMAWTDYVETLPFVDKDRMGVTGGSYGGFMTNWIIGQTHRFKAAVTQRSILNRFSSYGTSDMNWMREEALGDEPPWDNPQNYLDQSPLKAIGKARTPTLILHSENDMRCPIEQGEQLFVALKRLGVDTEFVRFPDESHGLSRSGRTDRRIVRLEHILRWFDKYLK